MIRSNWQALLHEKMRDSSVERWVSTHTPMVMAPKPLFTAVRRVLGIAVFGFVRYPMPDGTHEIVYERLV